VSALWSYLWPLFAAGFAIGAVLGLVAFRLPRTRRSRRNRLFVAGAAASLAAAGLWSGPLGAADRFTNSVERDVRAVLDYYEMTQVTAHLHRAPLTRRLILAGPADDFQRSELVRMMGQLPGVSSAGWSVSEESMPLIAESLAVTLAGFLAGLLVAYVIDLRRRYNLQWNW
jgi:hypothetical protein